MTLYLEKQVPVHVGPLAPHPTCSCHITGMREGSGLTSAHDIYAHNEGGNKHGLPHRRSASLVNYGSVRCMLCFFSLYISIAFELDSHNYTYSRFEVQCVFVLLWLHCVISCTVFICA